MYFLDTVETIPQGVGFSTYDPLHLCWLAVFLIAAVCISRAYKRADAPLRRRLRFTIAGLTVLDELFKMVMLFIGGNYIPKYLPLHLCSINIILIAIHVFKPTKAIDNFLYAACIPAAIAALIFPSWTSLPLCNFMHIHSFTVHILLALYPIMLTYGGDIKPKLRDLPRTLLLLILLAAVAFAVNTLCGTNFMFLREPETGNPLVLFEQLFGNHLIGFPFLLALVIFIMYFPLWLKEKRAGRVKGEK